ncbi:hypothetical protein HanRHA438_Chr06g0263251 [Helianthus annuus]|uniref:Transmembrane protein n=1 Tax=Helianthus annuus TaxID=4232 RepID=A0A251UK76_HELAN|nr:uncharacterized protein LOC110865151 [Helianthus annuus]KAF5801942.1 hypothetical protein HanXRQr2_Chr06g0253981 [Helianthus annuus]KAJ0560171.1 hypothetical protein HanHA300_Chr06g0208541 [Helianthus annuus]KAJ0566419.1 hypothetical protein HanIR_Chr06g0273561 [Helianthus annuus]KAJ0573173.1 hypothetical protein HanHA89_Chr06g0223891 [Helianthus annuus]KAJ0737594.1 hypothetical protein HanLR1_Chr06g0208771 [Helianthus annuus]
MTSNFLLDLNKIMTTQPHHHQDQNSRVFHELSALILNLIRHPTPVHFSGDPTVASRRHPRPAPLSQITPAGFASMLLGISLALMLCGSITFIIGFLLMPWVLGLVMLFYVAGIVSSLSVLGRAIFGHTLPPYSPRKSVPAWKLSVKSEGDNWTAQKTVDEHHECCI